MRIKRDDKWLQTFIANPGSQFFQGTMAKGGTGPVFFLSENDWLAVNFNFEESRYGDV